MDFATLNTKNQTETTNGMPALVSTMDANVDLFFNIGASRGKDILPAFQAAYLENREIALRVAKWARDSRGGSGERQLFRDILAYVETVNVNDAQALVLAIPELGRWDDIFALKTKPLRDFAFGMVQAALASENGLCAKWMPRKGKDAEALREYLQFSPKRYRKTLVTLTKVVETQMCAKDWENINFSHVPSLAAARYKKAFKRNADAQYTAYAELLASGEAKINAGAVYPYDVLKGLTDTYEIARADETMKKVALAQWAALPNFVGDASILPVIDVSGSMDCIAGKKGTTSCMDVAVSLGLYLAEKNTGAFANKFVTFTDSPQIISLEGNVLEKIAKVHEHVGYSTNLEAALVAILREATTNKVPQAEMPKVLLLLSDMQFDGCTGRPSATAIEMIRDQYTAAGYTAPQVVFWNLNVSGNVPVKHTEQGVALVSGFSPAIVKTILASADLTPVKIMMSAVMVDRYALQ